MKYDDIKKNRFQYKIFNNLGLVCYEAHLFGFCPFFNHMHFESMNIYDYQNYNI